MGEVAIKLKLKYRNPNKRLMKRGANFGASGGTIDPPEGTWTFNAGRFKPKSSNEGKSKGKERSSLRPRMKVYWGNVSR